MRSYFYENWADTGNMPNSTTSTDNSLRARELNYSVGQPFWDAKDRDGEPVIALPEKRGDLERVDVRKFEQFAQDMD